MNESFILGLASAGVPLILIGVLIIRSQKKRIQELKHELNILKLRYM